MSSNSSEKTLFSWIHLSDIHFMHGNERHQVDQELVLKALLGDISKTINNPQRNIPRPDSIFITGDITFSGSVAHKNEYEIAEQWLNDASKVTNLTKNQIFVIPGNHDVQRNIYSSDDDLAMLIDNLRSGQRLIEWALKHDKYYEMLMSRFENFNKFSSKFAPFCLGEHYHAKHAYWQWTSRPTSELPVRLIGLNTALLCQDDYDKGKLRLSLNQLKDIPNLDDSLSYLVIGLGHHPFYWLADGEDAEKWLRKKIHIYLSGHVHYANSIAYRLGGGSELICIQAGAVHKEDDPRANQNSFNYAAIVQKEDGIIALRVWNKIWSETNKDFRDDAEFHPIDQSFAEFELKINRRNYSERVNSLQGMKRPNFPFYRKSKYVSDSPPVVDIWVGREEELNTAKKFSSGVLVVTGIGGQGKSTFASKYLNEWVSEHPNSFWDWRDCKEQRERFHAQLVGMIEHWTDGNISGESLEGGETKELVRFFFDMTERQTGLIILDNVDHYVDVENREFTLGVSEFVKAALQYNHNLIILITCRPRVNYASTKFQEIHLDGISEANTLELFHLREVDVEKHLEEAKLLHHLTDGHPFWLNLIAAQIASKPDICVRIINELESGEIDNRAKIMMDTTWKGLDIKHKVILRYMAELVGSEDIDWLYDCVKKGKEFKTMSQFKKTFFDLHALNLIVESIGKYSNRKEYDLHPIVRNYIISEFKGRRERKPYQDGVLWVINTYINQFGRKISIATPFSELAYYIKRAEISIKQEDVESSIQSLLEVAELLIHRGMPGDLFRVGADIIELAEKNIEKYIDLDQFHLLNTMLGRSYVEYGRRKEAISHIERYARLVPKGTAQYVSVCAVSSYVYWMIDHFDKAIEWGKEGVRLKVEEHIDTRYDSGYELALAQRDSGNIQAALDYFKTRLIATIQVLGDGKKSDDDTQDYDVATKLGNIGRCFQFQKKFNLALRYFIASANLLEKQPDSVDIMNQGYAALWIDEVLEQKGEYKSAYIAYRKSEILWSKRAPLRVQTPRAKAERVSECVDDKAVFGLTDTGIERIYKEFLENNKELSLAEDAEDNIQV